MPTIERRMVYKAGQSLAITLPRSWLRYMGIEAGDMVEVFTDNILTVRPVNPEQGQKIAEKRESYSA